MGIEMRAKSNHARLTEAGWSYRKGVDRDWLMYRDPDTKQWHSEREAVAILDARQSQATDAPASGPAIQARGASAR